MKVIIEIYYGFNGFDNFNFLKEFSCILLNFVFNCRFYFVFLVVWTLTGFILTGFIGVQWKNK